MSQSEALIDMLAPEYTFFHAPDGKTYAASTTDGSMKTFALQSDQFEKHVTHLYFQKTAKSLRSASFQEALRCLHGLAQNGQEEEVYYRLAHRGGNVYVDLGNSCSEVVIVTPNGWAITRDCRLKFIRPRSMKPLPTPTRGGKLIDLLTSFVNTSSDDLKLLVSWLLSTFQPTGGFPILQIKGEQGTAKTTTSRMIGSLIDPHEGQCRSVPKNEHDLTISLRNCQVRIFENISEIPNWLSDALCRVSTGQSFATRTLYTDEEETIISVKRPIVLNGIGDLAKRSDLIDRLVSIELQPIPEHERKTEATIWAMFEKARPGILGALFDTVSAALSELDSVKLTEMPRMADFAKWATAAAKHLEWHHGEFLELYTRNRKSAQTTLLEESPVAAIVDRFMPGKWKGTATELLKWLNENKEAAIYRAWPNWPKTPLHLGNELTRVAPLLRLVGISFTRTKSGNRFIEISRDDAGRTGATGSITVQ